MVCLNGLAVIEIGDGACQTQDAVVGSCAELQAVDDLVALIESGLGETPLCSETAEEKRETDD